MDLKEIVAISGMGGLFKVVAKRGDGLIVSGFEEDRPKFVPNRLHVFTPLDGITLYTHTDNIELSKVLLEMKKQAETDKPVDGKESNEAHKEYFRKIVPDFDEERVYISDIRKVVKWYHQLDAKDLIKETPKEETKEEKPAAETKETDTAKEKPKKATKVEKPVAETKEASTKEKPKKDAKGAKKEVKKEDAVTEAKPKAKKTAKPKAK